MALTKQQQTVIDTLQKPDVSIVTSPAVAGSGKTHTLIELAKQMNVKKGLYLAYNNAIATEASTKFKGTNVTCSTIHALAWRATVKQYGLSVGYFKASSIKEKVSSTIKRRIVDSIEEFCLSNYTDPNKYLDTTELDSLSKDLVLEYLDKMANNEVQCTHSFYLKLYHIYLVTGEIAPPEVDLLMMDEAGDITALTVEIFKLINAPKKIAVGDLYQNIYSFNNTINGFKALEDVAVNVPLTNSFRVSSNIAHKIENFIALHLDPDFEFIGNVYDSYTINSSAYIARNNSGLLEKMFVLMNSNSCFHTGRSIDSILELPLILANLGNGKKITTPGYWHIEKLRSAWTKNKNLQTLYPTVGKYVRESLDEPEIVSAYRVVTKHGPKELNTLAKYARAAAKKPCDLMLTTAHSSKGLEFDEVMIAPDLNEAVTKALANIRKYTEDGVKNEKLLNKYEEELRLYYTAVSRTKYELHNAIYLD